MSTTRSIILLGALSPHDNLLVTLMNAMGLPDTTFGQADWCTGPLEGLAG